MLPTKQKLTHAALSPYLGKPPSAVADAHTCTRSLDRDPVQAEGIHDVADLQRRMLWLQVGYRYRRLKRYVFVTYQRTHLSQRRFRAEASDRSCCFLRAEVH